MRPGFFIKKALPHLLISLLAGLAVIVILHGFNPMMGFLTSVTTKVYIFITCFVGVTVAVCSIVDNERHRQ